MLDIWLVLYCPFSEIYLSDIVPPVCNSLTLALVRNMFENYSVERVGCRVRTRHRANKHVPALHLVTSLSYFN